MVDEWHRGLYLYCSIPQTSNVCYLLFFFARHLSLSLFKNRLFLFDRTLPAQSYIGDVLPNGSRSRGPG